MYLLSDDAEVGGFCLSGFENSYTRGWGKVVTLHTQTFGYVIDVASRTIALYFTFHPILAVV